MARAKKNFSNIFTISTWKKFAKKNAFEFRFFKGIAQADNIWIATRPS